MKTATLALLWLQIALVACASEPAPEPAPMLLTPAKTCPSGCLWTYGCFPRYGCPDNYCPNPLPRQCWPPYPPFYRCVSAGECGHPPCVGVGHERLTWWFMPTPRALREALWCQP
jgi:hypothetical protein